MGLSAERLAWYANRLRAMGPREIVHRVEEAAKRRISRRTSYRDAFGTEGLPLPALDVDRDRLALVDGEARALWRAIVPRDGKPGSYHALGQGFTISDALDWHRDPTSGLRWPDADYCFDIPYRHDAGRGDVKLVWEINRLQVLPAMAACGICDRDDAPIRHALTLLESWIDANPPFKGVNWASGIELALRIVSILLTVGLAGRDRIDARLADKIAGCLAAHAYWLARYPSRYSSANNHLIAEAAALYILGTLWPRSGMAGETAVARATLIAEAFRQIHDDGVGAEQSPTYTAFTCEWYLLAFAVAREAGTPFPPEVVARIAAAGEHLRWLLDEAANHPRIGDDDEGRVIGSGRGHEPLYVASIVNAIAAAADRPDLAVAAPAQLRNAILGSPGIAKPPVPPNGTETGAHDDSAPERQVGLRVFEQGGYTVCRRDIGGRRALIVFDHGPLGYLSIAAHGHADALSVLLHIGSQPVFVDAGTYLYHAGGAVRDRLRGTAAHNTLCLDHADQSEIAGAFNWRRKADARLVQATPIAGGDRITTEHDGYVTDYGLIHRRTLAIDGQGFAVADELVAQGARPRDVDSIEIGFLLHPDCSATLTGGHVMVEHDGAPLLRLTGSANLTAHLIAADYSPAFGVMRSTRRICFRATTPDARAFDIRVDLCEARPAPEPRSPSTIGHP